MVSEFYLILLKWEKYLNKDIFYNLIDKTTKFIAKNYISKNDNLVIKRNGIFINNKRDYTAEVVFIDTFNDLLKEYSIQN